MRTLHTLLCIPVLCMLMTVHMRQGGAASVCEGKGLRDPGPEQRAGAAEEGGGGEVSACLHGGHLQSAWLLSRKLFCSGHK